jgi:hypothetical protein
MTVPQLAILAGLAGVACLLFCVTGGLAAGRGLRSLSLPPESTPTAQPTSTSMITPTVVPTQTSTPLIPYEQLIPNGWTQHKTQLIEIWLPPDFKNVAPGVVSAVAGESVLLDLAQVSTINDLGYPTSMSVSYEPLTSVTLEEFLDVKLSNIPPEINLVENREVSINSQDAIRLMFESKTSSNLNINDLLFVFQDGGTVWYVKYSAEITNFYERLPEFEQSVNTFRMAE